MTRHAATGPSEPSSSGLRAKSVNAPGRTASALSPGGAAEAGQGVLDDSERATPGGSAGALAIASGSTGTASARRPAAQPTRRPGLQMSGGKREMSAAAGNSAHAYIGKACCLLLLRADYIGPCPGRGPELCGKGRPNLIVVIVVVEGRD